MASRRCSVLVVDDDADIRRALRMLLEGEGYAVEEAPDGRPALARLQASDDGVVVLLDYWMPGMDGHQLLEVVAADETLKRRHAFALLTANAKSLPRAFATLLTDLGVPVLDKPFQLDALFTLVADLATRLSLGQARSA